MVSFKRRAAERLTRKMRDATIANRSFHFDDRTTGDSRGMETFFIREQIRGFEQRGYTVRTSLEEILVATLSCA